MNPINTGRFIRIQRKKLNLSQSALAAMLFVEPQTVSKWERGLGMPDYDNLDKLREIFACSLSDILEPVFDDAEDAEEDTNADISTNLPVLVGIIEGSDEDSGKDGRRRFSIFDFLNKKKIKSILERMFGYEYANTYNESFLFKNLFRKRKKEEYESTLTQGMFRDSMGHETIGLEAPWLYARLFLFLLVCTGIAFVAAICGSPMPFVIMGGLCSVFPLMMFLFESNFARNLSITDVLGMFTLGGLASIVLAMLNPVQFPWNEVVSAVIFAPVFEEIFKAAISVIFIARIKPKNMITGLLIGFSVGAGFSFFENIHYAYNIAIEGAMEGGVFYAVVGPVINIIVRTVSDFFASHHYWTGFFAAVYVLFKESTAFSFRELFNWRVLLALASSITLHATWNGAAYINVPVLPQIMMLAVCVLSVLSLIILINVGVAQSRIMGIWESYRTDKEDEGAENEPTESVS